MSPIRFENFYFGMTDSRNEAAENAREFTSTFVDLDGAVKAIIGGSRFMVLGPKGTGKSAIAWYLALTSEAGAHIAKVRDASTLPITEIPKVATGQQDGFERSTTAWKFLLLCNFLQLLLSDEACSLNRNPEVVRVAKHLRKYGFMDDAAGKAILSASKVTVNIPIPKVGNIYTRERTDAVSIYNLIPYLEDWVNSAESSSRQILIIDGLDSILLNDAKYDQSIASLIQAAYLLNQRFREHRATGSIVLLVRNDVFARVSSYLPDSQKYRDDLAVEMDWRVLGGAQGTRSPLLAIANRKAAFAVDADEVDVLSYLPSHVSDGTRKVPILQYLLNLTRHTPRDLLKLLDSIRETASSGIFDPSGPVVPEDCVKEGALRYCNRYFEGAIRNEFAGFGGLESGAVALEALRNLRKGKFEAHEFELELRTAGPGRSASGGSSELLRLLFFAGAIGNLVPRAPGKESYMQFFHRRDATNVYLRGPLIVHDALRHAWSLPRAH